MAPGRTDPMLGRLALVLAALVAGLLVAEAAVRVVDRWRCLMSFSGSFWEPHVLVGWRHTPGASGWAKRCFGAHVEWESFTRVNSLGLRDREVPYARSDAFRILVLGDSYTEGMQVDVEETFARRLERRLNGSGGGRRVEVLNAGCSGYGTDNALLFYRVEGRRYRPDLVLLAFDTGNDVFENYAPLMRRSAFPYGRKPYFVLEEGRLVLHDFPLPAPRRWPSLREAAKRALWRHSFLYRVLVVLGLPRIGPVAVAAEPPARPPHPIDTLRVPATAEWQRAWRLTRALLRRLRHDVERDGARLVVAVLSSPWEVSRDRLAAMLSLPRLAGAIADYDPDAANRRLTRALERARVTHVGLVEPFRAHLRETGTSGYFDFDEHWDAAGHALAAELIADGLVAQGLVPGHAPGGAPRPGAG